ncbi:GNAT family N-acetyltransferase [Mesorhizobium loti]|nr:GNAT family N-acetyltransferase [Mesorhizobium loti]
MDILIPDAKQASRHLNRLAEILRDSVERGALVGFVLPFGREAALAYWHSIFTSIADGERLLFCAMINGEVAGTVQLYLSPEPNAPHRAEIFKLLVHRDFQHRGIGAALMYAAEEQATRLQRSLLLLDTAQGSDSERLYRRLGWQEIGVVPRHFVDPFGHPRSSVYFMKFVD